MLPSISPTLINIQMILSILTIDLNLYISQKPKGILPSHHMFPSHALFSKLG